MEIHQRHEAFIPNHLLQTFNMKKEILFQQTPLMGSQFIRGTLMENQNMKSLTPSKK